MPASEHGVGTSGLDAGVGTGSAPQQRASADTLELKPASGPVRGGTLISVKHHKEFGAAHDIMLGNVRLNCSTTVEPVYSRQRVPSGEDHSRCCCTPGVPTNASLAVTVIHRADGHRRATASRFVLYSEPKMIRLTPARTAALGGIPVTLAVTGWPAHMHSNAARCRFGESTPVPAVTVFKTDAWASRRPSGETWLRCVAPERATANSRDAGTNGGTVGVSVAPNGIDFGPAGLTIAFGKGPSLRSITLGSQHAASLHGLAALLAVALLASALVRAFLSLRRSLTDSGWLEPTPIHHSAQRWHGELRRSASRHSELRSRLVKSISACHQPAGGLAQGVALVPQPLETISEDGRCEDLDDETTSPLARNTE